MSNTETLEIRISNAAAAEAQQPDCSDETKAICLAMVKACANVADSSKRGEFRKIGFPSSLRLACELDIEQEFAKIQGEFGLNLDRLDIAQCVDSLL